MKYKRPFYYFIGAIELIIILMFLIMMLGCSLDTSKDVEYRITGSAVIVDITINNSDDGTSQYSDVSLPWSYMFEQEPGFFLYVAAQNQGNSGTVTTSIYVDGDIFKTSTSSGAYVIASAYGSLE